MDRETDTQRWSKQIDLKANKFWGNFIAKETMSLAFKNPWILKSLKQSLISQRSPMSKKQVAKIALTLRKTNSQSSLQMWPGKKLSKEELLRRQSKEPQRTMEKGVPPKCSLGSNQVTSFTGKAESSKSLSQRFCHCSGLLTLCASQSSLYWMGLVVYTYCPCSTIYLGVGE